MRESSQVGFTLIELMVTLAITAILATIAIPSYTAYIMRSNRSDARAQLLEVANWMERWRTDRGRYDDPASPGNPPPTPPFPATYAQSPPTGAAKYNIAVATPTAVGYTITATATGMMTGDVCTTLTLTETGVRGFTTGGGGTQDICWNR
jgi:type IV pilus assembly protein PilE